MVKYDNNLNLIPLKNFSKLDNNIFFAILHKIQNKNTNEIIIKSRELIHLIGNPNITLEELARTINDIAKKVSQCIVSIDNQNKVTYFTIFQKLEIDRTKNYDIIAQISAPFAYLINELKCQFTVLELFEFSNLKSKYSQTLYRLLKQFISTGIVHLEWNKFMQIMCISEKLQKRDIEKNIIKVAVNELAKLPLFSGLEYMKIKTKGQGNKITGIIFKFISTTNANKYTENKIASVNIANSSNDDVNSDTIKNYIHSMEQNDYEKLQTYIGTPIKFVHNDEYDNPEISVCKICQIGFGFGTDYRKVIKLRLKNSDDGYISDYYEFKNERHLLDWLKKNKV